MNVFTKPTPEVGVRSVDVGRGQVRGEVSAQWFNRPDDQKFLSLDALYAHTARRRDTSFEELVGSHELRLVATKDDSSSLLIQTPGNGKGNFAREIAPTHYSFGQLCSLAGAPAAYLRGQHAWRASLNLQADILQRGENMPLKVYGDAEGMSLRAATGPDYGRIYDADLVATIQRFAGNGTGDTRWKVPGMLNWGDMTYNPYVDVTKETTTLFASDRDVFVFLCDDTHPIEVGKLANGDPDLIFRGFYSYNSEVGARSMGIATMWLRGICQNRNLWGVEDFDQLRIVHSKHGNDRFVRQAVPTLENYAASEPTKLLAGINAAKEAKIKDVDQQKELLNKSLGFSLKQTLAIMETVEREEGHPAESIWDLCNGITAMARTIPNQDNRLEVEKVAAKLMNKAARNAV